MLERSSRSRALLNKQHRQAMKQAKNTITREQYTGLWNLLYDITEENGYPDFWTMDTLDAQGEQCGEAEAVYALIEVQDFDNKHDFGFIEDMLYTLGVKLDRFAMLDCFDLRRFEEEEEPRPLQAAIVEGSGEYGRLYGYELILTD